MTLCVQAEGDKEASNVDELITELNVEIRNLKTMLEKQAVVSTACHKCTCTCVICAIFSNLRSSPAILVPVEHGNQTRG